MHGLVMISCKFLELIVQILSQLGPSPGMLGESERAEEKLVISNQQTDCLYHTYTSDTGSINPVYVLAR